MNFRTPDNIIRWLGPSVIIGIGTLFIVGSPRGQILVCSTTENCIATWVGALSGWAALFGALLTVAVMREQLAEQKRQTDHLMGNAEPEIYATGTAYEEDNEWYPAIGITVINRNRRPLEVKKLTAGIDEKLKFGVRQVEHRGEVKRAYFPRSFRNTGVSQVLDGKEDGAAAERCVILCNIYRDEKIFDIDARDIERWNEYDYSVELECILKGSDARTILLSTRGKVQF
ncbi:hypothetical protein ASF70_02505 [Rhizobium sp. Leaf321]|uniref:hypothetical protein n=1 Tax=Rhizobium sp. Leaf321 TaxID=1736335 RepID=UPI00071286BE|nr:hypothetical protein [Rhizobium sp. Leaf321]KQQ78112.1 hypothetical protein ASF70_02505 [Rhizobium sp. Leaf321]